MSDCPVVNAKKAAKAKRSAGGGNCGIGAGGFQPGNKCASGGGGGGGKRAAKSGAMKKTGGKTGGASYRASDGKLPKSMTTVKYLKTPSPSEANMKVIKEGMKKVRAAAKAKSSPEVKAKRKAITDHDRAASKVQKSIDSLVNKTMRSVNTKGMDEKSAAKAKSEAIGKLQKTRAYKSLVSQRDRMDKKREKVVEDHYQAQLKHERSVADKPAKKSQNRKKAKTASSSSTRVLSKAASAQYSRAVSAVVNS